MTVGEQELIRNNVLHLVGRGILRWRRWPRAVLRQCEVANRRGTRRPLAIDTIYCVQGNTVDEQRFYALC